MLKFLKFFFSFNFSLCIFSSCAQKTATIDKMFYEVKGPIKTKTLYIKNGDKMGREVYHFNPKGELQKIEHFNCYGPNDEVSMATITNFDRQEDQTRYYNQTEIDTKNLVDSYFIRLINRNTIQFFFENTEKTIQSNRKIKYNEDNQSVKSISKGVFFKDSNYSKREYFYSSDKALDYVVTKNYVSNTVEKVWIKNAKIDQHGNLTYAEYQDEDGKIVYTLVCEYTYYE